MLYKNKPTCLTYLNEHKNVPLANSYKKVYFFEESYGGVSMLFGDLLVENGFKGEYVKVTAEGFTKQASVKSCLKKLGLTCDEIATTVKRGAV